MKRFLSFCTAIIILCLVLSLVWQYLLSPATLVNPAKDIASAEVSLLQYARELELQGKSQEAKLLYLKLLSELPDSKAAHQHLAGLYFSELRIETAQKHAFSSLGYDDVDYSTLLIASGIKDFRETNGTHALSQVQKFLNPNQHEYATDILKNFLHASPHHLQGQGWFGQALAWGHSPEFSNWNNYLPVDAESHSEVWYARGIALLQIQNIEAAANCFLKVLELNPLHLGAATRLQTSSESLFDSNIKRSIQEYAQTLQQITVMIDELELAPDAEMMKQVSLKFKKLGEFELARAWAKMSLKAGHDDEEVHGLLKSLKDRKAERFIHKFSQSIDDHELNNLASINWSDFIFTLPERETELSVSPIQFRDVAQNVGIDFRYLDGSKPGLRLGHLFETIGGGIGILDFDLDGCSDLYFAQGGDWRNIQDRTEFSNTIFRNLSGASARNVTQQSGLNSSDYSHGVAIGDYNADGFPDIYVCQLRKNRMFENQGDGTFVDVTENSKTDGDEWSLSAAFADFNGDGLSDLYVVNYLDRDGVEKHPCEVRGHERACPPKMFDDAADRFYLNTGSGQFRELSRSTGISDYSGKGMGIIAADFDKNQTIEIFIGNDGQANSLFRRTGDLANAIPKFEQIGSLSGVAYDSFGKSEATMGIVAADFSNDGRLDLMTTNFYGETNTYYQQNQAGGFQDKIQITGELNTQSQNFVGFGVQATDVDLDGDFDLIIANGHVDRSSVTGEPDTMLAHLFENTGQSNFSLTSPDTVGEYFKKKVLGRAIAKLDWNNDGKQDFCVTHLDQPVALLINTTSNDNHFLRLNMIAVSRDRSAIGSVATIRCGEKTWTQQVTSGDGYLVTNEKNLMFGLNSFDVIDEIHVKWNSGVEQSFHNVESDKHYFCIENRDNLIPAD